jgi:hypothetical protein
MERFKEKLDSSLTVIGAVRMILSESGFCVSEGFVFTAHFAANGVTVPKIMLGRFLRSEWPAPDWHAMILQQKGA